jgi:sugar phosphate isomerase/epimerase
MRDVRPIRIGGQTAVSAATVTEPFEYAVSHRFDAFEWFPDRRPTGEGWLEIDIPAAVRQQIRQTAREHDIALSVHASWHANPLTAQGLERLASQAEFAAEIGASTFVVHSADVDTDVDRYLDGIAPLVAPLAAHGIRLAVENTPATGANAINEIFRNLRARSWQRCRVGLCLDVGHANLYAETRNDYLAYVDRLAPEVVISHVHLHENWGDQDSHLTLFTGPAGRDPAGLQGLVDRLVRRRFAGCIILEQWPNPPALLDLARDRLADLIAARGEVGATSARHPSL